MTNILAFPKKDGSEPTDDEVMLTLAINGKGEIELVVNAWQIETIEQHNWLIAKMVEAASRLIDRKNLTAA